jgi:hypothetical protein
MTINTRLVLLGSALLDIPPLADPPDALLLCSQEADIGSGDFQFSWTTSPLPANTCLWLYSAVVDSAGINYVKNLTRLCSLVIPAATSPYVNQTDITDRFGTLQVGQKIITIGRCINNVTGLISAPLRAADVIVKNTP